MWSCAKPSHWAVASLEVVYTVTTTDLHGAVWCQACPGALGTAVLSRLPVGRTLQGLLAAVASAMTGAADGNEQDAGADAWRRIPQQIVPRFAVLVTS